VRVLQVIETGGPGGAETVFASLASGLNERGHEVWCVIAAGSWLPQELMRRGIEATIMHSGGSLDSVLLSQLRRMIRDHRIELVHAHLFEGSLYASLAARLEGIPCVTTLHGQADVGREGWKAWVKRTMFARAVSCVVAVSDALRHELQSSLPIPASRFRTIVNGVDREPVHLSGQTTRGESTAPRLIAIGNIRQPKDYPTLLDALAIVRNTLPAVHLDIAGEPDRDGLDKQLRAKVERLHLHDHVTFHGFVADPAPLLARAHCFVLSSSREGFSLATIEAMLAGIPVVATRSGGPQEILRDGETGLLVPTDNAAALADAIVRMLSDAPLAQRCREQAVADAARRFTLPAMVTSYEHLYTELLAGR